MQKPTSTKQDFVTLKDSFLNLRRVFYMKSPDKLFERKGSFEFFWEYHTVKTPAVHPLLKTVTVKSPVRPTLEYVSSSWNPHTNFDVNRLEQVQKNAVRFVYNNYKTSTSTFKLVKSLGWDTLEQRRLLNQSVFFLSFTIT